MFQYGVVDVLFMIVSVILIILVALQSSKQGISDFLNLRVNYFYEVIDDSYSIRI